MRICFRVDASNEIGSGHVMRCLTLADELQDHGAMISFFCRPFPGDMRPFIASKGFKVCTLGSEPSVSALTGSHWAWLRSKVDEDAMLTIDCLRGLESIDWLIVDSYAIDERWESQMRSHVQRLMVIDDLADRDHDCDLLLDQNLCDSMDARYASLLSTNTRQLLGPNFALLRPQFVQARNRLTHRDGRIRRVLISFGGADPTKETIKVLHALNCDQCGDITVIDVVVGSANPMKREIETLCEQIPGALCHHQVDDMATLMQLADIGFGAGGSTSWERCCVGLPALVAIIADNQRSSVHALEEHGCIINLGWAENLSSFDYKIAIERLERVDLSKMTQRGLELVDGYGVARVVSNLLYN